MNVMLLAEVADAAAPVSPYVGQIIVLILEIVAGGLSLLIGYYVKRLLTKAGMDNTKAAAELIDVLVQQAVDHTDGWARSLAEKPKGDSKMQTAVDFLETLIHGAGLVKKSREALTSLVEAKLAAERKAGLHEVTPETSS